MLVPPKPSGNIHIAAFYVYKDEARDDRMKIAAFIDAGEKVLPLYRTGNSETKEKVAHLS